MILDTNALSALADGEEQIRSRIETCSRLIVPTVVLGEYFFGIRQSRHKAEYESWLNQFMRQVELATITSKTAHHYADLRLHLKKNGTPIPANDVWIAAISLQHQLPILSQDTHFDLCPDPLQRISWN